MAAPSRSPGLNRWLESVGRRRMRSFSRRRSVALGDFGVHAPRLDEGGVSVYDVLVRRFLRPRLARLAGPGLLFGVDADPRWTDVLPGAPAMSVVRTTGDLGRQSGAATVDWVLLDRCLQQLPDPTVALDEIAKQLRPDATLITLFTGIARAEPNERRPLWTVLPYAARRLHEESTELERTEMTQYGNVTLALAWLYRLPASHLTDRELTFVDLAYPVVVAVTSSKRGDRQ